MQPVITQLGRFTAAAVLAAGLAAGAALAAGDGGGSGGSGSGGSGSSGGSSAGTGGSGPIMPCPRGQIRNNRGTCVTRSSGLLDDQSIYAYGAWLAQTGRYGEAIETLALVENKDDPRVLNYLGYANRQLGRFEVGLGYYRQALAADPDYVKAREYLGEAYVVLGQVDLARQQLGEIGTRCGTACEEYRLLAEAIGDYDRAKNG
jgi:tetratricopeptide (TPR) repeat protein